MSESPILAIPEMEEGQNNKYATHNDAIALLEAAIQDVLANASVGAGPWTLTESEATQYMVYRPGGSSGAFNLVFPTTINGNNAKRFFAVNNTAAHDCTVKAAGSGTTVVVPAGSSMICYQTTDDIIAFSAADSGSSSYDFGFSFGGTPTPDAVIQRVRIGRAITIPADFAGASAGQQTNPTADPYVITVKDDGASIGTISIAASGTVTFATVGNTAKSVAAGSEITFEAPSDVGDTIAGFSCIILASED